MHRALFAILIAVPALLGLAAEYLALGAAAAVETLFYVALLGFVIGVLRILLPRRSRGRAGPVRHARR